MESLTDSDLMLLRAIAALTEQGAGKPPTLAEIAVHLGMQSSSRGNIQRQLTRLRPTYVDWDSRPRSLTLTRTALALISRQGVSVTTVDPPIPDITLSLLASGLTRMAATVDELLPLQAPFPDAWQRGLNMLAVECLMRNIPPPTHTQKAVAWCKTPPSKWQVRFSMATRFLDDALLDENDQPTQLCLELAEGIPAGNAERELCERRMGKIRQLAELQRRQDAYVAVRQYLIEHPVVGLYDLIAAANGSPLNVFGSDLHDMYEIVPEAVIEQGQVALCGHCGWTLRRTESGLLRCNGLFCAVLTNNFTKRTTFIRVPDMGTLLRVRVPIRTYVVAPGRYELDAYNAIRAMGIMVTLWPNYDAYDLHIRFDDGEIWAIDIKDWMYPHLLAPKLTELPIDFDEPYDKAFYAIPDARTQENPSYLPFLQTATVGQPFAVMGMSDLLAQVRERKKVIDARR